MEFIRNVLGFHRDVFLKIKSNGLFFIFLIAFYLGSDFLKHYQAELTSRFIGGDSGFLQALTNLTIGIVLLISYLSYACLWSVYFKRRESLIVKSKAFFGTLLNFRMYIVYFTLIFSILLGVSLGFRSIPALDAIINEAINIANSKEAIELSSDDKLSLILNSVKVTELLNNISGYQIAIALLLFITAFLAGYLSFLFSLPLVIRDKTSKAFASLKTSLTESVRNLPTIILTIFIFFIFKLFIETYVLEFDYINKIVPVLLDSILFFYIVIGLEKFILTNVKK